MNNKERWIEQNSKNLTTVVNIKAFRKNSILLWK